MGLTHDVLKRIFSSDFIPPCFPLSLIFLLAILPCQVNAQEECFQETKRLVDIVIESKLFKKAISEESSPLDIPMVGKLSKYLDRELSKDEIRQLIKISDSSWDFILRKGYHKEAFIEAFSVLSCREILKRLDIARSPARQAFLAGQGEGEGVEETYELPFENEMVEAFRKNLRRK